MLLKTPTYYIRICWLNSKTKEMKKLWDGKKTGKLRKVFKKRCQLLLLLLHYIPGPYAKLSKSLWLYSPSQWFQSKFQNNSKKNRIFFEFQMKFLIDTCDLDSAILYICWSVFPTLQERRKIHTINLLSVVSSVGEKNFE